MPKKRKHFGPDVNESVCLFLLQDDDGGDEDASFDPGYEPDWAVISNVKKDSNHVSMRNSGAVSASVYFILQLNEDEHPTERLFLLEPQVSGLSLCRSQSSTLCGGPASL